MYFPMTQAKIKGGKIQIVDIAAILSHINDTLVQKLTAATGSVLAFLAVSIKANRNSFQEKMKQKTKVTTSPGNETGSIILKKAPNLEHPSTIAASSSSLGIPSTKLFMTHIVKGMLNVRYTMQRAI